MTPDDLLRRLMSDYEGLAPKTSWGETSLFYNPGLVLANGVYFATIKERDGDNDRASLLDREGVFRLSFGLSSPSYEQLFGPRPARAPKGGVVTTAYDYSALDQLTPHPVYGWMGWVQVLAPGSQTVSEIAPLLRESHDKARQTFAKRTARASARTAPDQDPRA